MVDSEFVFGRLQNSQNGIGLIDLEGLLSLLLQKGNFDRLRRDSRFHRRIFIFGIANSKLAV